MAEAVLDASAILAFLRHEPGQDIVRQIMARSLVLTVNLSEVVSKLIERGASDEAAARIASTLPFQVVPFDEDLALSAGLLWSSARKGILSLGDRACIALAVRENLPALTTDRAWTTTKLPAEIRLIR